MTTILLVLLVLSFAGTLLRPKLGIMALLLFTPWSSPIVGHFVSASKSYLGLPLSPFEFIVAALWGRFFAQALVAGRVRTPRFAGALGLLCTVLFLQALRSMLTGDGDWGPLLRGTILFSSAVPIASLRLKLPRLSIRVLILLAFVVGTIWLGMMSGIAHGGVTIGTIVFGRTEHLFLAFTFNIILSQALVEIGRPIEKRVFVALSLIGVLQSLGRTFWLAASAQVLWVLRRTARGEIWVAIMICAIFGFAIVTNIIEQRMYIGAGSAEYRLLEIVQLTSNLTPEVFLLGMGLGARLPDPLAQFFDNPRAWWIHNEWLLMLYTGGVGLLLLYGWFWINLWRSSRLDSRVRNLIIGLLVTSLFAGQLLSLMVGPWLGALVADGANRKRHPETNESTYQNHFVTTAT